MKNNKFPECCAIWRIEFQKRGALHVHMIVFGVEYICKDWRLAKSISVSQQEELMRNMARDLAADTTATDTSRLLRLPTFHNKKPEQNNFKSVMLYPTESEKINSTSFEELASFVENYQEGKLTSFSSGARHVPCARSGLDTSQSAEDWATVNEEIYEN
jgi:hypothetical protein